jgi:hypothetical protein
MTEDEENRALDVARPARLVVGGPNSPKAIPLDFVAARSRRKVADALSLVGTRDEARRQGTRTQRHNEQRK